MNRKKKVIIEGTLVRPLVIGKAAVIQENKGVRITSNVRHFITSPNGEVKFETMNSWYVLRPAGKKVFNWRS